MAQVGAGDVAPNHLMMGLGDHVAVAVAGGVGWKLGCVQKMIRVRRPDAERRRVIRTSYIHPVSLVSKPSGLEVNCNWFQPARGGRRVFSYTESRIAAVHVGNVIRKVTILQMGKTTKWELDEADRTYLAGGSWRLQ